jgi:hypothetical protein
MINAPGIFNNADYQLIEYHLEEGIARRKSEEQLFATYTYFIREGMGENKLPYYWTPAVLVGKTDITEYNKKIIYWRSFLFITLLAGITIWGLIRYFKKIK